MFAGFAKRDITPDVGVFLAGNGEYQSIGVHDPLYARAMVLDDGKEWTALVSADLIGIELETTRGVRDRLAEASCGKPEHVFISCTHTHNGPHTRFSHTINLRHRDEHYLDSLQRSIAEAIADADMEKAPVSLKYARGYAFEGFNRRITMPDGRTYFYTPGLCAKRPDVVKHVHGVVDPELDALQLVREDGSALVTAVNYAAHPLTVGIFENVISADYPGALVADLESSTKGPAIFFQGAGGDIHSKGLFEGFERMEEMGRNLSRETTRILSECGPAEQAPNLRVARAALSFPVDKQRRDAGKWTPQLREEYYDCEMAAISLGPVAFLASPGELLCEPGLQIKWNSPFEQTWILYNTNAYAGYLAHRRAYTEGGYEGDTNQSFLPQACGLVIDAAGRLLQQVKDGDV